MKTISQIIAGAQALLAVSYDPAGCFEEYLSDEYKTFLHILRVVEEQIPSIIRPYAGTGRIPYQYTPFIRSFLYLSIFPLAKPPIKKFTNRNRYDIMKTCRLQTQ
jgi:hypothetical protein